MVGTRRIGDAMAVVDALYAATYDGTAIEPALLALRDLLGASSLCIARHSDDPDDIDGVATGFDAFYHQKYVTDFRGQNLVWNAALPLSERSLYHERTLFAGDSLRGTAFWNEWMAPQDMDWSMGAKIAEAPKGSWLIGVQRSGRAADFDRADLEMLEMLLPTLRRMLSVRERFGEPALAALVSRAAMDSVAFGMIVVDRDGRVVHANAAAEAIIGDRGAGIDRKHNRLAMRRPQDDRTLQALIVACCAPDAQLRGAGGYLVIPAVDPRHGLSVHVGPLSARAGQQAGLDRRYALLLVRARGLGRIDAAHLKALFGMTAAEAGVALLLAQGLDIGAIAEAQGCAVSTVRTHLARLFDKTGTGRQGELVALLNQLSLPVG